jgi:hypothetical protein
MKEGLKISEFSIKMTLFLPLNNMTLLGHHRGKFVFQSQNQRVNRLMIFSERLQH